MLSDNDKLLSLLAVIPVVIFWTLTNVLISAVMAGITFIQLVAVLNWSKGISLAASIIVAVAVQMYIVLQPKIRQFIARS